MRIFISCGGTGGHFYPGLALARYYQERGDQVRLLLSGVNSALQSRIAEKFGIASLELPRMPSPGKSPRRWIAFLCGLAGGFFMVRKEMKKMHPDLLISMGSFAGTPAVLAAKTGKIPLFLHDGNARIGRANRVFSSWAKVLGTAFPPVNGDCIHCPVEITGMPVRQELEQARRISRQEALDKLNAAFGTALVPERTTLLIFGGSQGAAAFNKILPQSIRQFEPEKIQVIHLAGKGKTDAAAELYRNAEFPVLLLESDERMALFYGAADLVICRSGGSSIAELALFGKAALLIPYPYAAEHHQDDNADYYVRSGAALKVADAELTPEKAAEMLKELLTPESIRERRIAAEKAAYPDAAARFAKVIEEKLR